MTTTNAPAIAATNAPALVWATKSGKERQAHSATAQTYAPAAVRRTAARHADITAIQNGRYSGFLRDVLAQCNKKQAEALDAQVRGALARRIDGVDYMPPTGAGLTACNKQAFRAFAEWVIAEWAAPAAEGAKGVKGGVKAGLRDTAAAALAWLDAQAIPSEYSEAPAAAFEAPAA